MILRVLFIIGLVFGLKEDKPTICLSASQLKLYPIAIENDEVISIDVSLRRTEEIYGTRKYGIIRSSGSTKMKPFWLLKSYLSVYDKQQCLKETTVLDSSYIASKTYIDSLRPLFNRSFQKAKKKMSIKNFLKPETLSFCDYQRTCNLVEVKYDSLTNSDHVNYNKKNYYISMIKDSTSHFSKRIYNQSENLDWLYVNSVRKMSNLEGSIVVLHLQRGHEIGMGWIASDPRIKPDYGTEQIIPKEYQPDFSYSSLDKSVYQEPMLHHGFGFDIFVVEERK